MTKKSVIFIPLLLMAAVVSCKKDDTTPPTTVCNVKGTYSGTSIASTGNTSPTTYKLLDNNFVVGSVTPTGSAVTFGGYRNTCDSVIMSIYYTTNSSYYLLEGKISNNANTISGTFKNLTITSDFGTFSITK